MCIKQLQKSANSTSCGNCGKVHKPRCCPVYNQKCRACGKLGHFAKVCRVYQPRSKVQYVSEEPNYDDSDESDVYIGAITASKDATAALTHWKQDLQVDNLLINFKLDTGADANIICAEDFAHLDPKPRLKKSPVVLKGYYSRRIPTLGICQVRIRYKDREIKTTVQVVPNRRPALLGSADCECLGLVKRVDTISQQTDNLKDEIQGNYPQLFKGCGSLPGTCSFVLKGTPSIPETYLSSSVAWGLNLRVG